MLPHIEFDFFKPRFKVADVTTERLHLKRNNERSLKVLLLIILGLGFTLYFFPPSKAPENAQAISTIKEHLSSMELLQAKDVYLQHAIKSGDTLSVFIGYPIAFLLGLLFLYRGTIRESIIFDGPNRTLFRGGKELCSFDDIESCIFVHQKVYENMEDAIIDDDNMPEYVISLSFIDGSDLFLTRTPFLQDADDIASRLVNLFDIPIEHIFQEQLEII